MGSPCVVISCTLWAGQQFPAAKIQRTCIYGTPYSILGAPDDYMEYRNYTFFEFSEQMPLACSDKIGPLHDPEMSRE